jgi:hypothetical protein
MGVLKDQGLAYAQRLAIHFEDLLTTIILDPEIVANRDHLLAHLVVVASTAWSPELTIVTPFFSSSWHFTISPFLLPFDQLKFNLCHVSMC